MKKYTIEVHEISDFEILSETLEEAVEIVWELFIDQPTEPRSVLMIRSVEEVNEHTESE